MDIVTALATDAKNFFATLSFDVLVLGFLTGVFFLWGLRSGKTRLINLVVSTYIATLLLLFFPFTGQITFDFGTLFGKYDITLGLLFLIVIWGVQVVIDYILELEYGGRMLRNTVNSLILSLSTAAAFLAGLYIIGAVKVTSPSVSFIDALYTNEQYLFALLLLPLVGVFIVAR